MVWRSFLKLRSRRWPAPLSRNVHRVAVCYVRASDVRKPACSRWCPQSRSAHHLFEALIDFPKHHRSLSLMLQGSSCSPMATTG